MNEPFIWHSHLISIKTKAKRDEIRFARVHNLSYHILEMIRHIYSLNSIAQRNNECVCVSFIWTYEMHRNNERSDRLSSCIIYQKYYNVCFWLTHFEKHKAIEECNQVKSLSKFFVCIFWVRFKYTSTFHILIGSNILRENLIRLKVKSIKCFVCVVFFFQISFIWLKNPFSKVS